MIKNFDSININYFDFRYEKRNWLEMEYRNYVFGKMIRTEFFVFNTNIPVVIFKN